MNYAFRFGIAVMLSAIAGLLVVIGVVLGPIAILAIVGGSAIFAVPITAVALANRPKAAIESAPKEEQQRELDPNDYDPRVDWIKVNELEAEAGLSLSAHHDKCQCDLCKQPYKVVKYNGSDPVTREHIEAMKRSYSIPGLVLPDYVSVTPMKDNRKIDKANVDFTDDVHTLSIRYTDGTSATQRFASAKSALKAFHSLGLNEITYRGGFAHAGQNDYKAGQVHLKVNYIDGTSEIKYFETIETARNASKWLSKNNVASFSLINTDNTRDQVEKAEIVSMFGGRAHDLYITYKDGTRQISRHATYELAKKQMEHVTAFGNYSLPGLDSKPAPENDMCSCVKCNPTFGITPAEKCIVKECTCRYCDPDTTAYTTSITTTCLVTGKPAPTLPNPFRDVPVLDKYKDANIGSLTRAVISKKLTPKQYHKLAKKYFSNKAEATLTLQDAWNKHYDAIGDVLFPPAPAFKVGDRVETTDVINVREAPDAYARTIHRYPKGYKVKIYALANGYARGSTYWFDTDYLKLVEAAPKAEYSALGEPKPIQTITGQDGEEINLYSYGSSEERIVDPDTKEDLGSAAIKAPFDGNLEISHNDDGTKNITLTHITGKIYSWAFVTHVPHDEDWTRGSRLTAVKKGEVIGVKLGDPEYKFRELS